MIKKIKQFITSFNNPLGDINFGYEIRPENQKTTSERGAEEIQFSNEISGSRADWFIIDEVDEKKKKKNKVPSTDNKK